MSDEEKRLKQYVNGLSASLEPWEFKSWLNEFLNIKKKFKMERVHSININVKVPLENPLENIPNATYLWVRPSSPLKFCYLINLNKELVNRVINGIPPPSNCSFEYYTINLENTSNDSLLPKVLKEELINNLTLLSNEDTIKQIKIGGGYNYINHEIELGEGNGYHFTWHMDNYLLYKITQDNKGFDFLNWTKNNPLEVKE